MSSIAQLQQQATSLQPSNMSYVKVLAESADLKTIPSNFVFSRNAEDTPTSDSNESIPIIDFSLLTSGTPEQQAKAVEDLDKACEDWNVFMLVNHGIPESLMKEVIDVCQEFFNLPEEEKMQYETKQNSDPIKYGSSVNNKTDTVLCWRDYLKLIVHPDFHCPKKPENFSDIVSEYSERTRNVGRKLMEGVSKALGLEEGYAEKSLELDSALQLFAANYYPRCPQPELAVGLPAHSDYGLFTLLIQNGVGGLQIQHDGKWITVNPLPNSIFVNTSDHLEIFSNGKYKGAKHRASVNSQKARISLPVAYGPSMECIVRPAAALLDREGSVPFAYTPMEYREHVLHQRGHKPGAKA